MKYLTTKIMKYLTSVSGVCTEVITACFSSENRYMYQ